MLLESVGESVEPRLLEVLSGVGLGAFWVAESQTLFLSGWASSPDVGMSRAFGLLGFQVAEVAESDGAPMPVAALARQLQEGPVMLGPLDMGELPYHPDSRGANGVDHFVLALGVEDGAVVVHDPAGTPRCPSPLKRLSALGGPSWSRTERVHTVGGTPPLATRAERPKRLPRRQFSPLLGPTRSPGPRFPRESSSAPRPWRPWLRPLGTGSLQSRGWSTCGDSRCPWV